MYITVWLSLSFQFSRKCLVCAGYNLTSDGNSVVVEKKTNKWFEEEVHDVDDLLYDDSEFGGGQFSDAEDDYSQRVLTKDYTVPSFEEQWG